MKITITKFLLAICFLSSFVASAQKKLVKDASFGKNGTYTTPKDSADYFFSKIFPLPNGGSITTGFVQTDTASFISVLKLDATGKPDPTFGKKGTALIETTILQYESVYKVIENTDKSLLILLGEGGSIIEADGTTVLRLNAKGELDESFAEGIGALTPIIEEAPGAIGDMIALPNGGFLTLSIFANQTNGSITSQLVQYKANGTIDSTYVKDGQAPILSNKANQVLIKMHPVGNNLLFSGVEINFSNFLFNPLLLKTDKKGKLDVKFGKNVIPNKNSPDYIYTPFDVKVAADSSILYVAIVEDTLGNPFYDVTKVKANGKVDDSFGDAGTLKLQPTFAFAFDFDFDSPIKSIELLNDGSVLTFFPADQAYAEINANLYDSKGVLDTKFGKNGDFFFSIAPVNAVFATTMQADGKILIAGAFGESMKNPVGGFVQRVSLSTNVATADASLIDAKLSVFPNPIQQQATVTYELQDATNVVLELVDVQGKIVQQLSKSAKLQGKQTENVDFSNSLPAGNYLLRLKANGKQQTIKVVKM